MNSFRGTISDERRIIDSEPWQIHLDDIDFDEEEQNQIEERYDYIHSLKRKYGNTIEEILNYQKEREAEIFRQFIILFYNEDTEFKYKNSAYDMQQLQLAKQPVEEYN